LQATAEKDPFDDAQLATMMKFARKGAEELIQKQKEVLKSLKLIQ
jgi:ribonuclease PH